MNYPTPKAVTSIKNGLTDVELREYDLRSVHSDGSVTFYWNGGRKIHVTAAGKVERTAAPPEATT